MYCGSMRIYGHEEEVCDNGSPLLDSTSSCHTSLSLVKPSNPSHTDISYNSRHAWGGSKQRCPNSETSTLPEHFRREKHSSALMVAQLKVTFCFCSKSLNLKIRWQLKRGNTTDGTLSSLHKWHFMAVFLNTAEREQTPTDKWCLSGCVREK